MARTKQTARKTSGNVKSMKTILLAKKAARTGKVSKKEAAKKPRARVDPAAAKRVVKRVTKRGVKALREIRKMQNSVDLLISRAPFQRTVREIAQRLAPSDMGSVRFSAQALSALQESAEAFIIRLMENSNDAAIHAKRVTIMAKDMQLAQQISRERLL